MRVFVTGATGAIGPHAVRALIEAGHQVSAMVRTREKAGAVAELGAMPVFVSIFDRDGLARAFAGHDAVVNLATAIPSTFSYPFPRAWRANARIRTEGTAAVVDAAAAAGVGCIIQESIALAYPSATELITEDVPLDLYPVVESTAVSENTIARFTRAGGTGVVLRFGLFYGPGSSQNHDMLMMAKAGIRVVYGPPDGYYSPIHLADAGRAVLAALHAPAGVYNIVDDEPITKRDYGQAMSDAVGRRPLIGAPGRLIGLAGQNMAAVMRSEPVSNKRFKEATGWHPHNPNSRIGWQATAALWRPDPRTMVAKALTATLGVLFTVLGCWATFAPDNWYQQFPGFGRHWVLAEPPFNAHLITDLGGFYLAVGITALVAAALGQRGWLLAVGSIAALEALPHMIFHSIHHHHFATAGDAVASVGVLAAQLVAGLAVIALARRQPRSHWRSESASTAGRAPSLSQSAVSGGN